MGLKLGLCGYWLGWLDSLLALHGSLLGLFVDELVRFFVMVFGGFTHTIQPFNHLGELLLTHAILAEFYKLQGI